MSRGAWIAVGMVGAFWLYGFVWASMWFKMWRLRVMWKKYWQNELTYAQVAGRQREMVRAFTLAGIRDQTFRVSADDPTKGGGAQYVTVSAFDNPFHTYFAIQNKVVTSLAAAAHYYRHETIRCFVPIYWPSVFLKFPEDVLVYFNLDPRTSRLKVLRAIWTALGAVGIVAKWRGLV